ncbi:MAG: MliC family protein [Burkholderiales bacterium]|nr:MliC family protein [Burkholderiales bacterium]MDE1929352.1 MliC family protein [Burkholderiales bacterium]MDE2160198.1 MliC family protein [Burkholderiales bacterium]
MLRNIRALPLLRPRLRLLALMLVGPGLCGCAGSISATVTSRVDYRTRGGASIEARYYALNDGSLHFVKIRLPDGTEATLPNVLSASGAKYSDDRRYVWWTRGNGAFLEVRNDDGSWRMLYPDCEAVRRR